MKRSWYVRSGDVHRRRRERCALPRGHVRSSGDHVPASQKEFVGALITFIREIVAGSPDRSNPIEEEKAEDMDLPFGDGRL